MNTYARALIVAAGLSVLGSGVLAAAADTAAADATPAFSGKPGHRGHGAGMPAGRGLLRALRQLNLSTAQQQSVQDILMQARTQFQATMQANAGSRLALANPGDPNYAAAVQAAKTAAVNRVQQISDLDVQIYNVLTPQQQAQLPQVLADLAAQAQQRRAARVSGHGAAVPR